MNNYQKNIINEDGTEETLIITSNDTRSTLDLTKKYKLANHTETKQNKFVKKFKNSILGADIGTKSAGFSNVAILATIIAVATLCVMYFLWRF